VVSHLTCRVQMYVTNAALWSSSVCSTFNMCWENKHQTIYACHNSVRRTSTTNILILFNGNLSSLSGTVGRFHQLGVTCSAKLTMSSTKGQTTALKLVFTQWCRLPSKSNISPMHHFYESWHLCCNKQSAYLWTKK